MTATVQLWTGHLRPPAHVQDLLQAGAGAEVAVYVLARSRSEADRLLGERVAPGLRDLQRPPRWPELAMAMRETAPELALPGRVYLVCGPRVVGLSAGRPALVGTYEPGRRSSPARRYGRFTRLHDQPRLARAIQHIERRLTPPSAGASGPGSRAIPGELTDRDRRALEEILDAARSVALEPTPAPARRTDTR